MRFKFYAFLITLIVFQLCISVKVFAQRGEVTIIETPLKTDAIFKTDSAVVYDFEMQNKFNTIQNGTLSYILKTPHGKFISKSSIPVSIYANSIKTIRLNLPPQKAGFYKVSFMLNVNNYDDTIRRVFGVGINTLRSTHPAPADFKSFWSNTKSALARVAPNYKVTERPDLVQPEYKVYELEMQSLDNVTIHGWMTLPKVLLPNEKLPVYLVLPGYKATLSPLPGTPHFADISLNVRGSGPNGTQDNSYKDEYITIGLPDKDRYILRGAIMDCERAMDYIVSNPELDSRSVCVTGGSMGAYLSLALAGIDPRIALVAADNPTFSDFRWEVGYDSFPMSNIERYASEHHLPLERVLTTLDYFDLKNFTPSVHAKTVMAIGLLDNFAPPNTEMVAYNELMGDKKMFIYSKLGHEVDESLGNFKGTWLYTNFHMFDRLSALMAKPGEATAIPVVVPVVIPTTPPTGVVPVDANMDNTTNMAGIPTVDEEVSDKKFQTSPVGMAAHPGSKSSIFKRSKTVFYDIDLKNNIGSSEKGTLSCQVTTKTGDNVSTTIAQVKLLPHAAQKMRMTIPLQRGGYYLATFILNLTTYRDTIRRTFGVDVNTMSQGDAAGSVAITPHPSEPGSRFSSKNTAYYTFDLKNSLSIIQTGLLSCDVRTMDNKFISLTSVAVKLPSNKVVSNVRINLPTQTKGNYRINFILKTNLLHDTLRSKFSVDTELAVKPMMPVPEVKRPDNETITLTERPGDKNANFKSNTNMFYNLDLKNNFNTGQNGHVSCQISSMDGKLISITNIAIALAAKGSKSVKMNLPAQPTGFYKVNFMINTNDYDDTVRRVFGVDVYNVKSQYSKPADFESFWAAARAELQGIDPHFKMIERADLSRGNDQVYLIEMQSIGHLTVRGWLTLPKDRHPNQKFPVYLALPGYGADLKPFHDMPDFAAIALNVRGQGNSNDVLNLHREDFLTYNIQDKNKYILRGAIMDCVRMIDFIYSRPELDASSIYSSGGSMGGFFSMALAGLDHRVTVATAGNPAFADWRSLVDNNYFPMNSIQAYAGQNNLSMDKILSNLDYFDGKNFASDIKCKVVLGIGLLDNLAPPNTEMVMYNNIPAGNKKLFVFPDLGHQVGDSFDTFSAKMVYDKFGVF